MKLQIISFVMLLVFAVESVGGPNQRGVNVDNTKVHNQSFASRSDDAKHDVRAKAAKHANAIKV
ncbi:hypothetical protein FQR65_LT06783 [Abscondita terminalis]|nr:hypothetical protein FQR65_LT06783 [Abscondita terminalis]